MMINISYKIREDHEKDRFSQEYIKIKSKT
jgi:hypothetical protein